MTLWRAQTLLLGFAWLRVFIIITPANGAPDPDTNMCVVFGRSFFDRHEAALRAAAALPPPPFADLKRGLPLATLETWDHDVTQADNKDVERVKAEILAVLKPEAILSETDGIVHAVNAIYDSSIATLNLTGFFVRALGGAVQTLTHDKT